MRGGGEAGGEKGGKRAAARRIRGPECYARLDLRADDHGDPLAELRRLYGVARQRSIPFSASLARRARPYGILDRDIIEQIIERDSGKPLTAEVEIPEA